MPTIQLNPNLWPSRAASIDGVLYGHGDEIDVTDEAWEDLRERWSSQAGHRMRTWMIVGSDVPGKVVTQVRSENLEDLTQTQLKQMAAERGLGISGTKGDLADRIRAYEENLAEAESHEDRL